MMCLCSVASQGLWQYKCVLPVLTDLYLRQYYSKQEGRGGPGDVASLGREGITYGNLTEYLFN